MKRKKKFHLIITSNNGAPVRKIPIAVSNHLQRKKKKKISQEKIYGRSDLFYIHLSHLYSTWNPKINETKLTFSIVRIIFPSLSWRTKSKVDMAWIQYQSGNVLDSSFPSSRLAKPSLRMHSRHTSGKYRLKVDKGKYIKSRFIFWWFIIYRMAWRVR